MLLHFYAYEKGLTDERLLSCQPFFMLKIALLLIYNDSK